MNKPSIYYAFSLFISSLFSAMFLNNNVFIGAVIAASFLSIIFFTVNRKFFIIIIFLFFIGIINFILFFNIKIPTNVNVRIINKKGFYCLGNYKGRTILLKGKINNIVIGDKVKVYGILKKDINYERGIIGTYYIKDYKRQKKDFIYYLYKIKRSIYKNLLKELGKDKASIIMALCYGDRNYLSEIQKYKLNKLGILHIISVSGLHMSIIYKILENILGLKYAVVISFIYLLFTGVNAATTRAFIMIVIFKFSKILFKNYNSLSSLSFAALILIFIKPYYPLNIGFMLSFLSTLGIIMYYKKVSKKIYRFPKYINQCLSMTLSAQCFSLPYIAFSIQNFSLGFILGNLFLVPMYSIIIVLGNIQLLFLNFKSLFSIINNVLNMLLVAIDGGIYLLFKICPESIKIGYAEGIFLIFIYTSYMLYKHKYKNVKYFPLCALILIMTHYYKIFPEINCINYCKVNSIIIKYRNNSIMLCNYDFDSSKEVIFLKEKYNIDKIVTNPRDKYIIKFGDNFYIKVMNNFNKYMDLQMYYKNKVYFFICNEGKKSSCANCVNKCDLIKIPVKNNINYNYKIIFNNIFRIY